MARATMAQKHTQLSASYLRQQPNNQVYDPKSRSKFKSTSHPKKYAPSLDTTTGSHPKP